MIEQAYTRAAECFVYEGKGDDDVGERRKMRDAGGSRRRGGSITAPERDASVCVGVYGFR